MNGRGYPACGGRERIIQDVFIRRSISKHSNRYDYSKVICPEHERFWQSPNNHLFGTGCPTYPQSNLEGEIRNQPIINGIRFEQEKGFDWPKHKKRPFLDFCLPDYNMAIGCQGGQHFMPVEMFGGEEFYRKTPEETL